MIVLVCGGRDFTDRDLLFATMDRVLAKYPDGLMIVQGAAKGADLLAEGWCKSRQRWSSRNNITIIKHVKQLIINITTIISENLSRFFPPVTMGERRSYFL